MALAKSALRSLPSEGPRSFTLDMPYPPSANKLWRAVNGRNIKSEYYRAWLTEAKWAATLQLRHVPSIAGPYRLLIQATAPDRRRRDLSNLIKALEDALVEVGAVADDSNCRELNVLWTNDIVKGGMIQITVTEIERESVGRAA